MEKLGMNQLKKLFKRICTPIERIDNGHYDFCRIYKVNLLKGSRPAVLKVYDLNADLSARKAAPSIALRDEKMKDFLIKGLSEKRRTRFKNMQDLLTLFCDLIDNSEV